MSQDLEPAEKPSETSVGKKWLANFATEDRETARLLIDDLEIKDHSEILTELRRELLQWAEESSQAFPAVLIPIRSQEDLPALHAEEKHVAYETFNPGAGFPVLPGSEADIGAVIRGIISSRPSKFLSPELTLDSLRQSKVRSIMLLTDYCGSGKQASQFVDTFTRNRTIASWVSSGHVAIKVLAYASSLGGYHVLGEKRGVEFRSLNVARSIEMVTWSAQDRARVVELCEKYADSSIKDQGALGYKESFGLYLSNQRVPNNLPQILIRKEGDWPGFFPDRGFDPKLFHELRTYEPSLSLVEALSSNGGKAVASSSSVWARPVPALRALFVLQLLTSGVPESKIFAMLKLGEDGERLLRTSLIALGLIDFDGNVTDSGTKELERSSWRGYKPPRLRNRFSGPVDYIPTQLR